MRKEYELTQEEFDAIKKACTPPPVMFLSGGQAMFRSQQENSNMAWSDLGKKLGFKPMTVKPIQGKGVRFFSAEPVDVDEPQYQECVDTEIGTNEC